MSRRTIVAVVIALIVVGAGVLLFALLGTGQPAMSGGPGMLYFYSPTCPICQGMKPIVDQLEATYGDRFRFVRIDVTKPSGERLARELGLVGQPNYVFFDSTNEETRRMAGPRPLDVMVQEIELTLRR